MNNVLKLSGKYAQANKPNSGGGHARMNSQMPVSTNHLKRLQSQIEDIKEYWKKEPRVFDGILISVHYNKIAAKSNRINGLFKGRNSSKAVVGAKFDEKSSEHIITYYLSENDLDKSIRLLSSSAKILDKYFGGTMHQQLLESDKELKKKCSFRNTDIKKSAFRQVIADASYIRSFKIETATPEIKQSIVTLYDVHKDVKEMLEELGIDILGTRILDDRTVYLDDKQLQLLLEKAPYLISMATVDLVQLSPDDFRGEEEGELINIPSPTTEPTIGVIDTFFDERVYFHEWVDFHDMVDPAIQRDQDSYKHGTEVSSIIVDGPRLNPWLDDGCGRFKVRHFGVTTGKEFSSFTIIKTIRSIIKENTDIKVWNLSLGSSQEINDNFISAEASILDQLQHENDIIFVVAGTNKSTSEVRKIGSPADSINSMVVNSVTCERKATNYSRKGLVLSFFAKPDVSYYGGSKEKYINVCAPLGKAAVAGTSFAAPWISRKLSYLIDFLGLNREVAKAMIIDAARGWNANPTPEEIALFGHGIVPVHISQIVNSNDDEIKFIVTDISEKWNTYNYYFPVPLRNDKYPYIARATMCYFPLCVRSQGVDYTCTELNLHFGRMGNDGKIKDIKGDRQNEDSPDERNYLLEGEARKQFRKWDNVKYIVENANKRRMPKKSYVRKQWGMEIKTNNRLDPNDGRGLRFGVVVTLKEIKGVNRIDEFIRSCQLNGWLVNAIDVQNRIEINQKVSEEIELE